ncbi:hypothetical protein KR044_007716, partial [Drosophila immigrans]
NVGGTLNVNVRLHRSGSYFNGAFPNISRPQAIGCYGTDESRRFQDDASNLGYLRLPPPEALPLDLNAGIEQVQRKPESPHKYHDMHNFCRYIAKHKDQMLRPTLGADKTLLLPYNFVTFRGILRQIMCTPYERRKDYRLMATRLNGTIYLAKLDTEADRLEQETMSQQQLDMCSWGFKFEQYCCTHDPQMAPDTSGPVNEAKEFDCIFQCSINGLQLLYGAEMDGIKSDVSIDARDPKQLAAAEFVELKTSAHQMNQHQLRSFNTFKTLNWWCQSFLVGIRSIFVGLRDRKGAVHEIKEYDVGQLHRNKPWNSAAVSTFLASFLHELQRLLDHIDKPCAQVMLDFKAEQGKVFYTVLQQDHAVPEEEQLLPAWYRQLLLPTT